MGPPAFLLSVIFQLTSTLALRRLGHYFRSLHRPTGPVYLTPTSTLGRVR